MACPVVVGASLRLGPGLVEVGYLCICVDGWMFGVPPCVVWRAGCVGITFVATVSLGLGGGGAVYSGAGVLDPGGVFALMRTGPGVAGAFGVVGICVGGPRWRWSQREEEWIFSRVPSIGVGMLGTMVMGAGVVGAVLTTVPVAGASVVVIASAPPAWDGGRLDWDHGPGAGAVGHAPMRPVGSDTIMVASSPFSGMMLRRGLLRFMCLFALSFIPAILFALWSAQ